MMVTIYESHLVEAFFRGVLLLQGSSGCTEGVEAAMARTSLGETAWGEDEDGVGETEDKVPDFRQMFGDERALWAKKVIDLGIVEAKHGDAVTWMDDFGYRNSNLLFWSETDGVLFPYTGIDDYGSVPPCFRVGEGFRPNHWINHVDHNSIVFLSDRLAAEIAAKVAASKDPPRVCTIDAEGCTYAVNVQHDGEIRTDFHFAEENDEGLLMQY